jgi:hypothetical protein
MVYLYYTLNLSDILFNQFIICRKVLFLMYYVIFMWATGGIKFRAKCHFIYYILRSYCWSHELFEILPRIWNNMHPPFLAHLTQRVNGHVSFCHHSTSGVRPSTITKLEKKYAPALKMKCVCKTQMMSPPDHKKL